MRKGTHYKHYNEAIDYITPIVCNEADNLFFKLTGKHGDFSSGEYKSPINFRISRKAINPLMDEIINTALDLYAEETKNAVPLYARRGIAHNLRKQLWERVPIRYNSNELIDGGNFQIVSL